MDTVDTVSGGFRGYQGDGSPFGRQKECYTNSFVLNAVQRSHLKRKDIVKGVSLESLSLRHIEAVAYADCALPEQSHKISRREPQCADDSLVMGS